MKEPVRILPFHGRPDQQSMMANLIYRFGSCQDKWDIRPHHFENALLFIHQGSCLSCLCCVALEALEASWKEKKEHRYEYAVCDGTAQARYGDAPKAVDCL